MFLLYHAYVYLEFLILACTIYILAPIDAIINDRDVYTHASKEEKPRLSIDKLQAVNYCYKTFFRVMVLSKMGLTEKLIRNRLLFDRKFVAFYQMLFGLEILKEDSHTDTGDFDDLMW